MGSSRPSTRVLAPVVGAVLVLGACSSGATSRSAASTSGRGPSTTAGTTTTTGPGSAGCDATGEATSGIGPTTVQHLRVGAVDRTFTVALPPGTRRGPRPLILQFHGFLSDATKIEADTHLAARGAAKGFVVATPNSMDSPTQWNEFSRKDKADDYGFVAALVSWIEARFCIDTSRVFAAGHSNGSAFTGFLPCEVPHTFDAIAMASATIPPLCKTERPSVYATAGTKDPQVPADGGTVGGSTTAIPPAATSMAAWRKALGCRAEPRTTEPRRGVVEDQASGCDGKRQVVEDEIVGGTHPWPGGTAAKADPTESASGMAYDATARILRFFATVP